MEMNYGPWRVGRQDPFARACARACVYKRAAAATIYRRAVGKERKWKKKTFGYDRTVRFSSTIDNTRPVRRTHTHIRRIRAYNTKIFIGRKSLARVRQILRSTRLTSPSSTPPSRRCVVRPLYRIGRTRFAAGHHRVSVAPRTKTAHGRGDQRPFPLFSTAYIVIFESSFPTHVFVVVSDRSGDVNTRCCLQPVLYPSNGVASKCPRPS